MSHKSNGPALIVVIAAIAIFAMGLYAINKDTQQTQPTSSEQKHNFKAEQLRHDDEFTVHRFTMRAKNFYISIDRVINWKVREACYIRNPHNGLTNGEVRCATIQTNMESNHFQDVDSGDMLPADVKVTSFYDNNIIIKDFDTFIHIEVYNHSGEVLRPMPLQPSEEALQILENLEPPPPTMSDTTYWQHTVPMYFIPGQPLM
jgi:hypothetical protein